MPDSMFAPGAHVRVKQTIHKRERPFMTEIVGQVEAWEDLPTGSWFAHSKSGRLWLRRLKLRKQDGELTLLVIDDGTEIAAMDN